MPIPPLPTRITMIATYVDVDPYGDVRAILSEPGSFAPGVQVEDPLLCDVISESNLTTTDNDNDTENPVNAAKEGKYKVYRITRDLCTNRLRRSRYGERCPADYANGVPPQAVFEAPHACISSPAQDVLRRLEGGDG